MCPYQADVMAGREVLGETGASVARYRVHVLSDIQVCLLSVVPLHVGHVVYLTSGSLPPAFLSGAALSRMKQVDQLLRRHEAWSRSITYFLLILDVFYCWNVLLLFFGWVHCSLLLCGECLVDLRFQQSQFSS